MTRLSSSKSLVALYFVLVSSSLAGCDVNNIVRDVISNILTGTDSGGCLVGCLDDCGCLSCDCNCDCACDCACDDCGCGDCSLAPIPGGFTGAHPGARIANAVQVRATPSAFAFLGPKVPALLEVVPDLPLPYFHLDLNNAPGNDTTIRLQLNNPTLFTPPPSECRGNHANGFPSGIPCVRFQFDLNYRSCTYSADPAQQALNCADQRGPGLSTNADQILVQQSGQTCRAWLTSDGDRNPSIGVNDRNYYDDMRMHVDFALVNEPIGPRAGFARPVLLDVEIEDRNMLPGGVADRDNDQLEVSDFYVDCDGVAGAFDSASFIRDFRADDDDDGDGSDHFARPGHIEIGRDIEDAIDDVMDDLLQDYALRRYTEGQTLLDNGQVCEIATSQADCPVGATFSANRKVCTINSAPRAQPNRPGNQGALESPDGPPEELRRCVAPVIGLSGRANVGGLLAGIAPGIRAFVDFLFAAGGNGVTVGNGYNVSLFGGLENLSHDACVPLLAPGDPGYVENPGASLPRVDLFNGNLRPGSQNDFDVGIAASEEFVNYALYKVWDAGMLCLTVTSSLHAQLSPAVLPPLLFSTGTRDRFIFPLATQESYLALALRPQQPPSATTETIPDPEDPSNEVMEVTIVLPRLDLDMYFWTQERYTRIVTVRMDLSIGLLLDVVPDASGDRLVLRIGEIGFEDVSVRNANGILSEDDIAGLPSRLASAGDLLASTLGGVIPPIALEELVNDALVLPGAAPGQSIRLPLRVDFAEDSIVPFMQDGHPFVGIFLDLVDGQAGQALVSRAETRVEITSVTLPPDRAAFAPDTLGEGPLPRVEIAMDASGPEGAEYEFSYRTTYSSWSPWSRSRYAVIEDRSLVLQQRQQVYARARIVGAPSSTDYSSGRADLVIDVTEPAMRVTRAPDGRARLEAYDFVYGNHLEYRVGDGAFRPFERGVVDLGAVADDVAIEVRDGSGNVASTHKLRGRGDPDAAAAGCGCHAAGRATDTAFAIPLMLASILGLVVARRRRRAGLTRRG